MTDGEETTLYHLIKSTKRREARMIRRTQDQRGRITEDPTDLSWSDQVNYTAQKAWRALHFIMRIVKEGHKIRKV